jgi:hypothetical protein
MTKRPSAKTSAKRGAKTPQRRSGTKKPARQGVKTPKPAGKGDMAAEDPSERQQKTYEAIRGYYRHICQQRGVEVDPDGDLSGCEPTLLELWAFCRGAMDDLPANLQAECLECNAPYFFFLMQNFLERYPQPPYRGKKTASVGEEVEYVIKEGGGRVGVTEACRWVGEQRQMMPATVQRAYERYMRAKGNK